MILIEKENNEKRIFRAAASCFTGTRHQRRGIPCHDAARYICIGGMAAAALCDGAGCAKFAQDGAAVCADTAARYAAENFDRLYYAEDREREGLLLPAVREAMFARAAVLGCDIAELSCTLLLTAAAQDGRSFFLHIGDGLILGLPAEGDPLLLSRYAHHYENVTSFVTSRCPQGVSQHFSAGKMHAFLLVTDGVCEAMLLAADGRVRAAAGTLLCMACTVPRAVMEEEYCAIAALLQKSGRSSDDIGLVSLAVAGGADAAVGRMSAAVRRTLFAEPKNRRNRACVRRYSDVIRQLSQGVVYPAQIYRGKKTRGKRYLSAFCRGNVVRRLPDGGYTIPE